MTLYEPATLVTDCLLGALAAWLAHRLRASASPTNRAARWWSRTLALTAASAFVGGLYHGFAPNLADSLSNAWWTLTLIIIAMMSATMDFSLLNEFAVEGRQGIWPGLILLKLAAFAVAVILKPEFVVGIADYGTSLLAWAGFAAFSRRAWRGWMFLAIGLSVAAAVEQQSRWSPFAHFNHNDIYHVIQAAALYGFYRAARLFGGAIPKD